MKNNRVNLFIVGAAKAGTSSVSKFLSKHNDVYMSPVKEPNYFSRDIKFENIPTYFKNSRNFNKINFDKEGKIISRHQLYINSLSDYHSLFGDFNLEYKYYCDASVSYLYSNLAAKEIFNYNPNSKIIIVLRDPIERAFSHYLMDLRVGRSTIKSFKQAVYEDMNNNNKLWGFSHLYIELGLYYEQIKRYINVFPKENILILDFNLLKFSPLLFKEKLISFLSLSDSSYDDEVIFAKENSASLPKNSLVRGIIQSTSLKSFIKKVLPSDLIFKFKSLGFDNTNLPTLDFHDYNNLSKYFSEDLFKLNRDFNIKIDLNKFHEAD